MKAVITHRWAGCAAGSYRSVCGSWRTSSRPGLGSTRPPGSRAVPGLWAAACGWSACRRWRWFCPAWGPPLPSSADTVLQSEEQSPWTGWPAPGAAPPRPPETSDTNPPTGECAARWSGKPRRWAVMCPPRFWRESGLERWLSESQRWLKTRREMQERRLASGIT